MARKARTDPIFAPSELVSTELYRHGRAAIDLVNEMVAQNAIRLPYPRLIEVMGALAKVVAAAKDEEISFLKAVIAAKRRKHSKS